MTTTWAAERGLVLDPTGDVPLGVQLDWALRSAIVAGRLEPGDRLPSLRELSDQLGVNHNTLRAAVARLEAEDLLVSRQGAGTFVAAQAVKQVGHAPLVDRLVRQAGEAGLSPRDLAAALYVRDERPPDTDTTAPERETLRDDIAMLSRLLIEIERRLPESLPPATPPRRSGPRLLSVEELRDDRDDLVRRLAEAQRRLDELKAEPGAEASAVSEARSAKRTARLAPRPGAAPA